MTDYIFDDGTIESKVLQHEIPDAKVIKVDKFESIEKWLSHVVHMDGIIYRIFLHFPGEDYTQKDIYTQVSESERRHAPDVRIVKQYEMATRESIQRRAVNYGIKEEPNIPDIDHPYGVKDELPEDKPTTEYDNPTRIEDLDSRDNFIARRETPTEDQPKKKKRFRI